MFTVYCAYGWNRKQYEIEKEVLDQVKLEESVANIHLRLPINLFNLTPFSTDLLFFDLGCFWRAICKVLDFFVVYFEALYHGLLVNILFEDPLNSLLNFIFSHPLLFEIFIYAVRWPLGMLFIEFWFSGCIDATSSREMLVSLDCPILWEIKLKRIDMLLQFQVKILLLRRPNLYHLWLPLALSCTWLSWWAANLIFQLVEIAQALVVHFILIVVKEDIFVFYFGDRKQSFNKGLFNVLSWIFALFRELIASYCHFDILHRSLY